MELHEVFYGNQSQGRELVSWNNKHFDDDHWRLTQSKQYTTVALPDGTKIPLISLILNAGKRRIILWYWYDVGGYWTRSTYLAKVGQAWKSLTGSYKGDALVVVVTQLHDGQADQATNRLTAFLYDFFPAIQSCLRMNEDSNSARTCEPRIN